MIQSNSLQSLEVITFIQSTEKLNKSWNNLEK